METNFHLPSFDHLVHRIDPAKKQTFYVVNKTGEVGIDSVWKRVTRFFTGVKAQTLSSDQLRSRVVTQLVQWEKRSLSSQELDQALSLLKICELLGAGSLGSSGIEVNLRQLVIHTLLDREPALRIDQKTTILERVEDQKYTITQCLHVINLCKLIKRNELFTSVPVKGKSFAEKYLGSLEQVIFDNPSLIFDDLRNSIELIYFCDQLFVNNRFAEEILQKHNDKFLIPWINERQNERTLNVVDHVISSYFLSEPGIHEDKLFLFAALQQKPHLVFSDKYDEVKESYTKTIALHNSNLHRIQHPKLSVEEKLNLASYCLFDPTFMKIESKKDSEQFFIIAVLGSQKIDRSQISTVKKSLKAANRMIDFFENKMLMNISPKEKSSLMCLFGKNPAFMGKLADLEKAYDGLIRRATMIYQQPGGTFNPTDFPEALEQTMRIQELQGDNEQFIRNLQDFVRKLQEAFMQINTQFLSESIWNEPVQQHLFSEEVIDRYAVVQKGRRNSYSGTLSKSRNPKQQFDRAMQLKLLFDSQSFNQGSRIGELKFWMGGLSHQIPEERAQEVTTSFDFSFCRNFDEVAPVIGILGSMLTRSDPSDVRSELAALKKSALESPASAMGKVYFLLKKIRMDTSLPKEMQKIVENSDSLNTAIASYQQGLENLAAFVFDLPAKQDQEPLEMQIDLTFKKVDVLSRLEAIRSEVPEGDRKEVLELIDSIQKQIEASYDEIYTFLEQWKELKKEDLSNFEKEMMQVNRTIDTHLKYHSLFTDRSEADVETFFDQVEVFVHTLNREVVRSYLGIQGHPVEKVDFVLPVQQGL